jgi:hypothetical protein
MENASNRLTAEGTKEGPVVSVMGDTYRIIIGGKQTNGVYTY